MLTSTRHSKENVRRCSLMCVLPGASDTNSAACNARDLIRKAMRDVATRRSSASAQPPASFKLPRQRQTATVHRHVTEIGRRRGKPAVTAYGALPNLAIVGGTFVAGFDVNGSVTKSAIVTDR